MIEAFAINTFAALLLGVLVGIEGCCVRRTLAAHGARIEPE